MANKIEYDFLINIFCINVRRNDGKQCSPLVLELTDILSNIMRILQKQDNDTIIDSKFLEIYNPVLEWISKAKKNTPTKKWQKKIHTFHIEDILKCLIANNGESMLTARKRIRYVLNFEKLYNSTTRLSLVIFLYLIESGRCVFTPAGLIEKLEQVEHPSKDYMFYIFKSNENSLKPIKKAINNLLNIIPIKHDGHKYYYIPYENYHSDYCWEKTNNDTALHFIDAIIKYRNCSKTDKMFLINELCTLLKIDLEDLFPFYNSNYPSLKDSFQNEELLKLETLITLQNKSIIFKKNKQDIYFKIEKIIESNQKYYIVGTVIPERHNQITESNILTHFAIDEISNITKSKKQFDLYKWSIENPNWLGIQHYEANEITEEVENRIYNDISKKIDIYVENKILNYMPISFKIKNNINNLKEDIENKFKIRNSAPSISQYVVDCKKEDFIEWALPRYNQLEILDNHIREKIEENICELYSHINRKIQ